MESSVPSFFIPDSLSESTTVRPLYRTCQAYSNSEQTNDTYSILTIWMLSTPARFKYLLYFTMDHSYVWTPP